MEIKLLIISFIILSIILVTVILINDYIRTKTKNAKSLNCACYSAIHSLIFNTKYDADDQESIIGDLLKNMNAQLTLEEAPFEVANIICEEDNILSFTAIKRFTWMGIKKTVKKIASIDIDDIGMGDDGTVNEDTQLIEETKTVTFIVDHEIYSQSKLLVGEQIEPPTTPLKPKYKFTGWYIKDDLDKEIITEEEWDTFRIAEDMTFIAQFKAKY